MVSFGSSSSNMSVEDVEDDETENSDRKRCKIYISYHWKCLPKVKVLRDELIKHECLDLFVDMYKIRAGMCFLPTLESHIQKADIILVCVTRDYVKSKNCEKELIYADGFGKAMLPLYVEKLPITELGSLGLLLAREKYCNLFK